MISPFQSCSITGNVIFFSYTVKGSKALHSRMKQQNALITSLLLIAPCNVGWDQISNNFQASSRDKTVPWREYMHKGRRHRCCVQWHGGGPAPCLWQPTFIQHEPVWLWARGTCHAGCQARTAVLCSVFLQSSDRSCTSSAPPYPCNKTFQGPLHKTCWIFTEMLCSRCRKEILSSGVSIH